MPEIAYNRIFGLDDLTTQDVVQDDGLSGSFTDHEWWRAQDANSAAQFDEVAQMTQGMFRDIPGDDINQRWKKANADLKRVKEAQNLTPDEQYQLSTQVRQEFLADFNPDKHVIPENERPGATHEDEYFRYQNPVDPNEEVRTQGFKSPEAANQWYADQPKTPSGDVIAFDGARGKPMVLPSGTSPEVERQSRLEQARHEFLKTRAGMTTPEGKPAFTPEQLREDADKVFDEGIGSQGGASHDDHMDMISLTTREALADPSFSMEIAGAQFGMPPEAIRQFDDTVQMLPATLKEQIQPFTAFNSTQQEFQTAADITGQIRKYWNRRQGRWELDPQDVAIAEGRLNDLKYARQLYDDSLEQARRQQKLPPDFETIDGVQGYYGQPGPGGRAWQPLRASSASGVSGEPMVPLHGQQVSKKVYDEYYNYKLDEQKRYDAKFNKEKPSTSKRPDGRSDYEDFIEEHGERPVLPPTYIDLAYPKKSPADTAALAESPTAPEEPPPMTPEEVAAHDAEWKELTKFSWSDNFKSDGTPKYMPNLDVQRAARAEGAPLVPANIPPLPRDRKQQKPGNWYTTPTGETVFIDNAENVIRLRF